jgi:hypothetical protein
MDTPLLQLDVHSTEIIPVYARKKRHWPILDGVRRKNVVAKQPKGLLCSESKTSVPRTYVII